ncbi:unnamed protein product [Camellia sinensis]
MNRDKGIDKALKPRRPGHRRHRRVRPENNGHGSGDNGEGNKHRRRRTSTAVNINAPAPATANQSPGEKAIQLQVLLLCFDMDMKADNDCGWKPKERMTFDSEEGAYDFYNAYGARMGFSIRREYCKKNKVTNQIISRNLVCNKEGFRKVDK